MHSSGTRRPARVVPSTPTMIRVLLGVQVGSHAFGLASEPLELSPLPVLHVLFGAIYTLMAVRLPALLAATERDGQGSRLPAGLAPARVLLLFLVVEHAFALVSPPYELGVSQAFHLSFGVLYALLVVKLATGRPWTRNLVTGLLLTQFIGRFLVFATATETWIKMILIPGTVAALAIFWLLWRSPQVRAFFAGSWPRTPIETVRDTGHPEVHNGNVNNR